MVAPTKPEVKAAIIAHHQQYGLTLRKISKALARTGMLVCPNTIRKVIKEKLDADQGIVKPPRRLRPRSRRTPAMILKVNNLISLPDPPTTRQIAAQLGLTTATVTRIIRVDLRTTLASAPEADHICQEDGCDFKDVHAQPLQDHLRTGHGYPQFESFRLVLPNKSLFQAWKTHLFETNRGIFNSREGKRSRADGSFTNGFLCSRSCLPNNVSSYFRLSFRCTARLRVETRTDGSLIVTGCLAHYGHDPAREWNDEKADPSPHITVPADSAGMYAGAFPLLQLPYHNDRPDGGMAETYLPLEVQTTDSTAEFPVSWEYITVPLAEEQKKTLADVSTFVQTVVTQMKAETTERALYEFELVKKLLDSFGRKPDLSVAVEAAPPVNPAEAEDPPAWMFLADGLQFSPDGEDYPATGLPVGDGELHGQDYSASASLAKKPKRLKKTPKARGVRPSKLDKPSKKTTISPSRIAPASSTDCRKSQEWNSPSRLRPRRDKSGSS